MPPALDLSGKTFGKLMALHRDGKDASGAWIWLCRCECARYVHVRGATLNSGRTTACASCAATLRNTTHGATGTDLYLRWRAMLDRCENRKHRAWPNYGGRGIKVCDEWHQFEVFSSDMGASFDPALELDRIDVNGHYELRNCRWITHAEQQSNRRTNHVVSWRGRTMTVTQWASWLDLKPNTIVCRLRRGWPVEKALVTGARIDVLQEIANG